MITLDSDIFKCCQNLKTLGWQNDAQAKNLLQRAANQVKPIMARRKWAVPLLTEFYPPAPNLLGLNHNHGQRIDIRLRSPSSRSSFLPYQSILGTLLHELAHIEVGPHNASFYKLLDQLNKECDDLIAAGNDGSDAASFAGKGTRLADWSVRTVPKHLSREKALAAALTRQRVGAIMSKGGVRLGGSADIARLCDPREMALAAAERRRADDIWCGSANMEKTMPEAANDVVVVSDDDTPEVIVISDDEIPSTISNRNPSRRQTPHRQSRKPVPVRQNPVALAAMRRAEGQG